MTHETSKLKKRLGWMLSAAVTSVMLLLILHIDDPLTDVVMLSLTGVIFFVYWPVSYFVSARFCANPRIARARRAARWALCVMFTSAAAVGCVALYAHADPSIWQLLVLMVSFCLCMFVLTFHLMRDGNVLLIIPVCLLTVGHERTAKEIDKMFERLSTRTMRWFRGILTAVMVIGTIAWASLAISVGVDMSRMLLPLPMSFGCMEASPDGRYVAFVGPGRSGSPFPICVIDSSARLAAKTSPTAEPLQQDFAFEWFPSGDELAFFRSTAKTAEPAGDSDSDHALLRLDVQTGDVAPVDLGERSLRSVAVVDSRTLICGIKDSTEGRSPGLYVATADTPQWQLRQILPDTEDEKWKDCLWSVPTDSGIQLIVEARGASEDTEDITTYWAVQTGPAGVVDRALIGEIDQQVLNRRVSPDGSRLALVVRPAQGINQAWLYSTEPTDGIARKLPVQRSISKLSFRPDGGELVLWQRGLLMPAVSGKRALTGVLLVDLKTFRCRELPIVKDLPGISGAAWLSNESLLIGVYGQGIVKLNPKTGKHSYIWRIPDAVE